MTRVILMEATPRDPGVGLVTVRASTALMATDATLLSDSAALWLPAIAKEPRTSIDIFGSELTGQLRVDYGTIGLRFSTELANDIWSRYIWDGAPLKLWRGESGQPFSSFTQILDGRAGPLERDSANGGALTLRGPEADIDKPLLALEYAGSGGAEGNASMKGVPKPWCSGHSEGVPGVLVDKVYWVWQVHGYGAVDAIHAAYELGLDKGTSAGDYASYAALIAATLTPAQWATCKAEGLVRLGGEPTGRISFDVRGAMDGGAFPARAGAIASHLIRHAGVDSGKVSTTSANALDAAFPHNYGFYAAASSQVGEHVRKAMADVAGYAFPDGEGVWRFGLWRPGKTATLLSKARDRVPLVKTVKQGAAAAPVGGVRVGGRRCWGVHSTSEISPALLDLLDTPFLWRGAYDSGTLYSVNDIVRWEVADGGDGSTYIRIGTGDTTGTDPSDGTKWDVFISAASAGPAGLNSAVVMLYARGASAPTAPTGTFTYTFATGGLSGGTLGAWSQAIPAADGTPLWVKQATASNTAATDTIASGEFSSAVKMVENGATGAAGLNNAVVTLYRRGATAPADPSGTFTYTFASGILSGGTLNSWSQVIPATDGNPLWAKQAAAVASGSTDSIAAAEFSGAVKIVEDGAGGADGSSAFTLIAYDNVSLTANSITKTGGGSAWTTGSAYTQEAFVGGAFVCFRVANGRVMVALNADPLAVRDGSFSYHRLDYAIHPSEDGSLYAYEGGTGHVINTSWTVGDILAVTYDGANVRYLQNGVVRRTVAAAAGLMLHGDFCIYPVGYQIAGIAFGAAGGSGINAATVELFQRTGSSTAPAVPDNDLIYTFATGGLSGSLDGWSRALPASGGAYRWKISALASSALATDTITPGEWPAPALVAEDGTDGAPGLSIAASPAVMKVGLFPGGGVKPGQLPQSTQLILFDGSTDVTASGSYSVTTQTDCTASHVATGEVSLSAVTGEPASFIVQASYGGKTININIPIAAPEDGPAASRDSDDLGAPNSSGSLVSIGSVDLVVANGATINVSGSLTYRCSTSGGGTRTVQLAAAVSLENLTDGGSPSMSSESNGSTAVYITGDGDSDIGQVAGAASYTNATGVPKTFRAKFYTRKIAGNGTARTGGGDFEGTINISAA